MSLDEDIFRSSEDKPQQQLYQILMEFFLHDSNGAVPLIPELIQYNLKSAKQGPCR